MFKSEELNKRCAGIQSLIQIANGDPSVLDTLLGLFESSSDQKELLLAFNNKSHPMWDFSGLAADTNQSKVFKRKPGWSDHLWVSLSFLGIAIFGLWIFGKLGMPNSISFLVGLFVQVLWSLIFIAVFRSAGLISHQDAVVINAIWFNIMLLPMWYGVVTAFPSFSILGFFPPISLYALGEAIIGLVR